jgi:hypothetical protein
MRTPIARLPRLIPVLLIFAIAAPENGAAQSGLTALSPGARVRVQAAPLGPSAQTARVVSVSADTIVVRPDHASGFDVTLPRAAITQLDVSVGRRTRKGRFALIGLGAGSLVGGVLGAASFSDPCKSQPSVCSGFIYDTRGSVAFGGAVTGALLGAAAGAITGQLSRTDDWKHHPLGTQGASLRVLPAPSRGRSVALVLSMAVRD